MSRTSYEHAIITKRIILGDGTDGHGSCAWPECDRRSTSLYEVVLCEHSPRVSCSATDAGVGGGRHYHLAFCRERCRRYWLAMSGRQAADTAYRNSGRIYGNLPPGYARAL